MVNSNESINLDRALEDILSVWGKDPTAQNIERYFGATETLVSASFSPDLQKTSLQLLRQTKKEEDRVPSHKSVGIPQLPIK